MSKLVDNTRINQTEVSIPDKEMHGLWLAASNALKALQTIQETKIPIEAVYLGLDALSQVVGLSRTPQALKPKLRRLYVNINLHLFEIANLTGQKKEDIVLWIEGASNPADKLGKFDINKDPVEKWISLANQVLSPRWLQQHPSKYLDKLISTFRKGSDHSYKEEGLQTNRVRILQMKLQSGTLVVMRVMCQYTPYNENHMTQPDYKDSSTGISRVCLLYENNGISHICCSEVVRQDVPQGTKWVAILINGSVKLSYYKTGNLTGHSLRTQLEDL